MHLYAVNDAVQLVNNIINIQIITIVHVRMPANVDYRKELSRVEWSMASKVSPVHTTLKELEPFNKCLKNKNEVFNSALDKVVVSQFQPHRVASSHKKL